MFNQLFFYLCIIICVDESQIRKIYLDKDIRKLLQYHRDTDKDDAYLNYLGWDDKYDNFSFSLTIYFCHCWEHIYIYIYYS